MGVYAKDFWANDELLLIEFHDYKNQYTCHVCSYLTNATCTSVWNMIADSQNNAVYGSVAHYMMCFTCTVSV